MAYRKIRQEDLQGKTIAIGGVDSSCCNVVKLTFTDGSKFELWAEDSLYTPAGYIPGIFVDDPDVGEE